MAQGDLIAEIVVTIPIQALSDGGALLDEGVFVQPVGGVVEFHLGVIGPVVQPIHPEIGVGWKNIDRDAPHSNVFNWSEL